MPRLLTLECDICGARATEKQAGSGLLGWGAVQGVGPGECVLCPAHRDAIGQKLDAMQKQAETMRQNIISMVKGN